MKNFAFLVIITSILIPLSSSFATVKIEPVSTGSTEVVEDDSIVKEVDKEKAKELADFKLKTFKSCENMENVLEKYIKEHWKTRKYSRRAYDDLNGGLAFEKAAVQNDVAAAPQFEAKGGDFSKTNTQVQGVDESDIIKTDGTNIYYYNSKQDKVYISDVKKKKIIKIIQVPNQFDNPTFYIDDATLSIVASGYNGRKQKTYVALYAISQKNTFSFQKLYSVDGSLSHSRKIGNKIYLVSNSYLEIPYYDWKSEDDIDFSIEPYIPKKLEAIKTKNEKKPYNIFQKPTAACNAIEYSLPDEKTVKKFGFNPGFTVVSVIDTKNIFSPTKTKVIAGSNTEIHMSLKSLYLTDRMYSDNAYICPRGALCVLPRYERGNNTLIHKMNLTGDGDVKYQTSNIVPGSPLTQYSMDEHDGYFRIITQTNRWSSGFMKRGGTSKKYTGLYILDSNLTLAGKLENLGNNENFKSSRYMGDKLYLVTFRDIDPFFVIDVKDPKKPKVLGELKIPGYSTYLHPYDDKHIIGLGYDTSDNGHGGVYNDGLKVDLYEVNYDKKCGDKNLSNQEIKKCKKGDYKGIIVKQKQSYAFGGYGSESEALHNPRMFMWNEARKTLFLPVTLIFNEKNDKYRATDFFDGMMAIKITPETIKKLYKISHIDMRDVHKKRLEKCQPFLKAPKEKKCVKLLNGEEYCNLKTEERRVPEYCFAGTKDGSYIASDRWKYRDQFVKRALWIGDQIFIYSDTLMSAHSIDDGDFEFGQNFESLKMISSKIFAEFNK
ncbi:hypothetical protein CSB09_00995 [Candidatus Gracilibacteria bacterium]|nr:MAG: hypothetical protein CSB09_00995 [Candidatus Gracilibacteria bacterium]